MRDAKLQPLRACVWVYVCVLVCVCVCVCMCVCVCVCVRYSNLNPEEGGDPKLQITELPLEGVEKVLWLSSHSLDAGTISRNARPLLRLDMRGVYRLPLGPGASLRWF
jgi:hypothetical protein